MPCRPQGDPVAAGWQMSVYRPSPRPLRRFGADLAERGPSRGGRGNPTGPAPAAGGGAHEPDATGDRRGVATRAPATARRWDALGPLAGTAGAGTRAPRRPCRRLDLLQLGQGGGRGAGRRWAIQGSPRQPVTRPASRRDGDPGNAGSPDPMVGGHTAPRDGIGEPAGTPAWERKSPDRIAGGTRASRDATGDATGSRPGRRAWEREAPGGLSAARGPGTTRPVTRPASPPGRPAWQRDAARPGWRRHADHARRNR
jgi:hypothetical protein